MNHESREVYTIGHSTHPIEYFIELLKQNKIAAVVDVRSSPFSRMNPQYNREPLSYVLNERNIEYVYLGKELGARSNDPRCYRDDRVQYDLLAETKSFKDGIARVHVAREKHRLALMCAEKEPLDCHRTILVARRLVENGTQVMHILADGSVEGHSQTLSRLLCELKISRDDLVRSEEESFREAYRVQGEAIAYKREASVQADHY